MLKDAKVWELHRQTILKMPQNALGCLGYAETWTARGYRETRYACTLRYDVTTVSETTACSWLKKGLYNLKGTFGVISVSLLILHLYYGFQDYDTV
jgi:hypothetical protein